MTRSRANLLLLLAGAIWGMGFVAQSSAMAHVGPWAFNAVKFALAALAVLPFAWNEARQAKTPMARGDLPGFTFIGVLLFAAAILQQIGIVTTSVTNTGFLTGLYVVFTPFFGVLLMGSRPHWIVWPAALLAFSGIVLVGGGSLGSLRSGDFLVIGSAVFWSLQVVYVTRFVQGSGRPLMLSLVQFCVATLLSGVGALTLETTTLASLGNVWVELVYGGVFSIGLAFSLQTIGQRYTTAPQAAIFLSSEALFAALFAAIFVGERIPALGFVGCACIFAAMLAVELVPLLRGRRSALPDAP
ncbi:MFS transporter [Aureimonas sp. SA4125]|uniref:DMT family transporter n=1 Tax=Aureimonas sp. SA4125 TaxID=2826993 RepID=UPI001CC405E8|nr:DMT family transporter [Aureimonas sp. SA4125]BDA85783.1 MFS transporter [Aureimonas sp. SA4125]